MKHYKYEDISVGLEESFSAQITETMMSTFREITGDQNSLHSSSEFAVKKGYLDKVCFGMLTASFLSTLAGVYLPGENSLIQSVETKFVAPVYVGDRLKIVGEVTEMNDLFHVFIMKVTIFNQDEKKVLRGKMQIQVI